MVLFALKSDIVDRVNSFPVVNEQLSHALLLVLERFNRHRLAVWQVRAVIMRAWLWGLTLLPLMRRQFCVVRLAQFFDVEVKHVQLTFHVLLIAVIAVILALLVLECAVRCIHLLSYFATFAQIQSFELFAISFFLEQLLVFFSEDLAAGVFTLRIVIQFFNLLQTHIIRLFFSFVDPLQPYVCMFLHDVDRFG